MDDVDREQSIIEDTGAYIIDETVIVNSRLTVVSLKHVVPYTFDVFRALPL